MLATSPYSARPCRYVSFISKHLRTHERLGSMQITLRLRKTMTKQLIKNFSLLENISKYFKEAL